ncbi:MAG: peptidoglycan-binding protein [bacterium]|nr:peptidoglycan-binding protein [bacterium]
MLTGQGLADYAVSKIGTPYVYGFKMEIVTEEKIKRLAKAYPNIYTAAYITKACRYIGQIATDCSGLISAYTGKVIGSAQMYSAAYTRLPISAIADMAPGTALWKSGHVGVYLGNGSVLFDVEAKGINYGTVKQKVAATKWQYGLTFRELSYDITKKVPGTWKTKNPYIEPVRNLYIGMVGQDVRWLQFELIEAGYNIPVNVHGSFEAITDAALEAFQQSAKIEPDRICGQITRRALICDM